MCITLARIQSSSGGLVAFRTHTLSLTRSLLSPGSGVLILGTVVPELCTAGVGPFLVKGGLLRVPTFAMLCFLVFGIRSIAPLSLCFDTKLILNRNCSFYSHENSGSHNSFAILFFVILFSIQKLFQVVLLRH